jgi:hypothetical protein
MHVRYYRINRVAYTALELSAITVGPRRLLLPGLIARLFALKLLAQAVPIGDPIADARLMSPIEAHDAVEIRKRYVIFQGAESALTGLGFTEIRYFQADDPRSPYECYSLYGIDSSSSIAVVCTVVSRGQPLADWIEMYSLLADGGTVRSSNHALAGVLRPLPSAIISRMPGASSHELLEFHRDVRERMRSRGARFVDRLSMDQAIQADRDYYQYQVAHWVETGLLIPELDTSAVRR